MSADAGAGRRSGVLCAGSLLVDVGKTIDAYPALDHLAVIDEVTVSTGGPGLNLAVDLRMLQAPFPVAVAGVVGEDTHGDFILAECARLDLDTTAVSRVGDAATSFTDAMVERVGGRRTFFHHLGANALLDVAGVDLTATRARILHVGAPGIHPLLDQPTEDGNGWVTLLKRARAAGLQTNLELITLDPTRLRELALPCLPHLTTIVVNELEAGALTGIEAEVPEPDSPADWDSLEAMATALLDLGVAELAVVHFPAGCVAATADGHHVRQGSVRVPRADVHSTTGAGDAFASGVLLGRHEGWEVRDALALGVAAAAACVLRTGTSEGVLSAEDCLALAARLGHRPVD